MNKSLNNVLNTSTTKPSVKSSPVFYQSQPMNLMNPMNRMNQMNSMNSMNPMNRMNPMNPMNPNRNRNGEKKYNK